MNTVPVDGDGGDDREADIVRGVLLVCSHNAERLRMAQAFVERRVRAGPLVRPDTVEATPDVRTDLGDRKPRKLWVEIEVSAGWAIAHSCGVPSSFVPRVVEDWDLPDPASKALEARHAIRGAVGSGTVEAVLDEILQALLGRLARQLRLEQLLPLLVEEFAGRRSEAEIRACADAILSDYDEASARGHVMTDARRHIRMCLRADRCTARSA